MSEENNTKNAAELHRIYREPDSGRDYCPEPLRISLISIGGVSWAGQHRPIKGCGYAAAHIP